MRIDNVNRIFTVLIATSRLESLNAAPVPAQEGDGGGGGGAGKEHVRLATRSISKEGGEGEAQLSQPFHRRSDSTGGLKNPLSYMPRYKKRTLVKAAKRDVKDGKQQKQQQTDSSDDYSTDSEYNTSDEEEGTHAGTSKWGPSSNQYWRGKWGGAAVQTEQKKTPDGDCLTEESAKNLPAGVCKQESVADNIVGV